MKLVGRHVKQSIIKIFFICLFVYLFVDFLNRYATLISLEAFNQAYKHVQPGKFGILKLNHSRSLTFPFFRRNHNFDCLGQNLKNGIKLERPLMKETQLRSIFSDCDQLFSYHYYPRKSLSIEEQNFPLAYVLLVNEHLEQVEILFNAIYQPQNAYCFHVDLKSDLIFYDSIRKLSKCFSNRNNVILVEDSEAVDPQTNSMIHAQLHCLETLTKKSFKWEYVIVLQGHDFPIKTNREIVEILKIHDGANDVELLKAPVQ